MKRRTNRNTNHSADCRKTDGRHTLKDWIAATRPWSFTASAMPVVVTTAYLFWKNGNDIAWWYGLWAVFNIVLFHAAGNVWSDYHDFKKGVDTDETTGAKTLTSGQFTPAEFRIFSLSMLALACVGGIVLVLLTGVTLLWIGLAGALLTLLYPFMKFNSLGDVNILLNYAFLPTLGTSFVVTGAVDWSVLIVALPLGLVTDGILHCNNTRDIRTDRKAGINTLAMRIGGRYSVAIYIFEVLFPYLWILGCAIVSGWSWIAVVLPITFPLSFPLAIRLARRMRGYLKSGEEALSDLDQQTAKLQLLLSLSLAAAFVVMKTTGI